MWINDLTRPATPITLVIEKRLFMPLDRQREVLHVKHLTALSSVLCLPNTEVAIFVVLLSLLLFCYHKEPIASWQRVSFEFQFLYL